MALDLKVIISALNMSGPGVTQAAADLQKLERQTQAWKTVGLGMIGVGTAIGGGLLAAASAASKLGETLRIASAKTGATVESLGALRYAAEKSDVPFETLTGSLTRLNRAATEGKLAEFGISVKDAEGKMKSADVILAEFAGYLEGLPDQASKSSAMMAVFGRSGADMAPLLNLGKEGITALTEEAKRMGVVMTKEGAESADAMGDEIEALKMTALGFVTDIGTIIAPAIKDLAVQARKTAGAFHEWSDENPKLAEGLTKTASKAAGLFITLGTIIWLSAEVVKVYAVLSKAAKMLTAAQLAQASATAKGILVFLVTLEVMGRFVLMAKAVALGFKAIGLSAHAASTGSRKDLDAAGEAVKEFTKEMASAVSPYAFGESVKGFFPGLKALFGEIDAAFGATGEEAKKTGEVGAESFENLGKQAEEAKDRVRGVRDEVQGLGADLGGLIPTAAGGVGAKAGGAGGAAEAGGGGMWSATLGGITTAASAIATAFGAAVGQRREVFGPGISGYETRYGKIDRRRFPLPPIPDLQAQGPVGNETLAPWANPAEGRKFTGSTYFGHGVRPGETRVRHEGAIKVQLEGDAANRQWTPEERRRFERQLGEAIQAAAYGY